MPIIGGHGRFTLDILSRHGGLGNATSSIHKISAPASQRTPRNDRHRDGRSPSHPQPPGATEPVTIPKRRSTPEPDPTPTVADDPMSSRDAKNVLEHALFEVKRIVVGQDRMIERL